MLFNESLIDERGPICVRAKVAKEATDSKGIFLYDKVILYAYKYNREELKQNNRKDGGRGRGAGGKG